MIQLSLVAELINFKAHTLDEWATISQLVVTGIALLALIGAIIQTLVSRASHRQALTYNYTARFADPAQVAHLALILDLFHHDGMTEDQAWHDFLAKPRKEKIEVVMIANLLEELGGMYNHGLLSKKVAKEFFGTTAHDLWALGNWFIQRVRSEDDPTAFEQWELMLRNMGKLPS